MVLSDPGAEHDYLRQHFSQLSPGHQRVNTALYRKLILEKHYKVQQWAEIISQKDSNANN